MYKPLVLLVAVLCVSCTARTTSQPPTPPEADKVEPQPQPAVEKPPKPTDPWLIRRDELAEIATAENSVIAEMTRLEKQLKDGSLGDLAPVRKRLIDEHSALIVRIWEVQRGLKEEDGLATLTAKIMFNVLGDAIDDLDTCVTALKDEKFDDFAVMIDLHKKTAADLKAMIGAAETASKSSAPPAAPAPPPAG